MRFALVCGALSLLAVGCQTHSSASLDTDELGVKIEAQAQASGVTQVTVSLQVAQGITYPVELSDEDTLLARLGDVERILEPHEDEIGGGLHYETTLPGNAEGEPVIVRLSRERYEDASAELVLPAPIVISYPVGDINYFWKDVSDSVEVEWHGGEHGDEVEIYYDADCDTVTTEETIVTYDTGSEFVSFPFGDNYGRCDFDMTVKRRNTGTLSGGWQGEAYGTTADRVSFQID